MFSFEIDLLYEFYINKLTEAGEQTKNPFSKDIIATL